MPETPPPDPRTDLKLLAGALENISRDLKLIAAALFVIALVGGWFIVNHLIERSMTQRPDFSQQGFSAIERELRMLRDELARHRPPPAPPVPIRVIPAVPAKDQAKDVGAKKDK